MIEQAVTLSDYSVSDLRRVVDATDGERWSLRQHPDRDGSTVTSRYGYVIHPDFGVFNDAADAAFIATFDPPMIRSMIDRIVALEEAVVEARGDALERWVSDHHSVSGELTGGR